MYRAPYVLGKADSGFSRDQKIEDPNIGWRFVNPQMKEQYGIDSMPETAESVAEQFNISREDQNLFIFRSQQKATREQQQGVFAIVPVSIPCRKQDPLVFDTDEYPRSTMLERLASLSSDGNASGVNDGAAAMLVVSKAAVKQTQTRAHGEDPRHGSRWCGSSHYGYWACACSTKTDGETGYHHPDIDVIELDEAFAAKAWRFCVS